MTGVLAERGWDQSWPLLLAAMALGRAIIFALGFSWLWALAGLGEAFAIGPAPFAAATVVKTLFPCALISAARDGGIAAFGLRP